MNDLYKPCHCCMHNEAHLDIQFSTEVLAKALKAIYNGLNVKDEIQNDAFEETLRIFNEATVEGLTASQSYDYSTDFIQQLQYNNAVFSAFRVHRMQNDMAARLIDENGKLKKFEQWMNDIEDISDHYCRRWLQTEYNTAVIRAQQAADWKRFEANADVFPNVRWMPTTSATPDPYHQQYWQVKLTLPINHPFWDHHRPGDRWNCKCSLQPTDEPSTDNDVGDFKPIPSVPGLDNNPGKDCKLFSDSHPYLKEHHPGAKAAVSKKLKAYNKEVKEGVTISTPYGKQVTEIIRKFEDEIRMNKDHEEAIAVNHQGKVIVRKSGTINSVIFSDEEQKLLKDSIVTHNHPSGWMYDKGTLNLNGTSFSEEDILFAVKYNLAEVRIVTRTMTYSLKRPREGWGITEREAYFAYNDCSKLVFKNNYKLISEKKLDKATASFLHLSQVCEEMANRCHWFYKQLKTRKDG